MCLPLCLERLERLSRRRLLTAGFAATAGASVCARAAADDRSALPSRFGRVVDLTHTLTPDFPTGSGRRQLTMERTATRPPDAWNMYRWHLDEHTGTHLDAPWHKSSGLSADRIAAADLVGPLAVIDLRRKAAENADAELTPDDLKAWESQHGRLPAGSIVAMCSGWDAHVRTARFRNADDHGALHTPGFHVEAVEWLLAGRDVKGIVVDTLSLDRGLSADFPVHVRWLGSNRWGLECAANLGALPPAGATIVVGGPKIAGASGGPSRVFALV